MKSITPAARFTDRLWGLFTGLSVGADLMGVDGGLPPAGDKKVRPVNAPGARCRGVSSIRWFTPRHMAGLWGAVRAQNLQLKPSIAGSIETGHEFDGPGAIRGRQRFADGVRYGGRSNRPYVA